jgi:uncharacterized protein
MSLYATTVPLLVHGLKAMGKILQKAEAHCAARKIDPAVMLGMRLAPDMFALTRQVQIMTDAAKGCGARLSQVDNPSFPDTESSFAELQARLQRCIGFLEGLDQAAIDGAVTRDVTVKIAGKDTAVPAVEYVNRMALPNYFFHMTTAYNILRHNGVELGKGDFLGRG